MKDFSRRQMIQVLLNPSFLACWASVSTSILSTDINIEEEILV